MKEEFQEQNRLCIKQKSLEEIKITYASLIFLFRRKSVHSMT